MSSNTGGSGFFPGNNEIRLERDEKLDARGEAATDTRQVPDGQLLVVVGTCNEPISGR